MMCTIAVASRLLKKSVQSVCIDGGEKGKKEHSVDARGLNIRRVVTYEIYSRGERQ